MSHLIWDLKIVHKRFVEAIIGGNDIILDMFRKITKSTFNKVNIFIFRWYVFIKMKSKGVQFQHVSYMPYVCIYIHTYF